MMARQLEEAGNLTREAREMEAPRLIKSVKPDLAVSKPKRDSRKARASRDGVFERKDRKGYWISYVDASGKRRKQKIVAYTPTQAKTALSQVKTRIQQEKLLGVKADSEITTEELLVRYKRHQRTRLRATTFERLDCILETLKQHLPLRAKDITRKAVAELISTRAEIVKPGTIQKEIAALKLAVEWELLNNNAAQGAKLPKLPPGRTRYLSPTELKAALEACGRPKTDDENIVTAPAWMRAPLALAAFTGMRRGELCELYWRDVDLENRRVYLRETKNGSLRVLMLNDLAVQVLNTLPMGQPGDRVLADVDPAQ